VSCRVAPFEFIYPALGFLFRVIQRLAELLPALGALLGSGLLMRFVDLLRSVGKVEQSVGERVGNQNLSNKDVVNPGQRCAEGNLGATPRTLSVSFCSDESRNLANDVAWATSMPYAFDWRNYVRSGCARNNYCDSGDCVARASRVKRVSQRQDLSHL